MTSRPGRDRLGVALLIPAPVSHEIDGLRRALGDPSLGRIVPHLTLVPPVNVRRDALGEALATLRRAAAAAPPALELTLGPVATFQPANPVLYLAVGGDLPSLRSLRERVFSGPLSRPLSWPYVPHVTLADDIDAGRAAAALSSLAHYRTEVTIDTVHLMRESDRGLAPRWEPLADAAFGPPGRIGQGGLTLELVRSRGLDPEAAALVRDAAGEAADRARVPVGEGRERRDIVVTARREGAVAGVAMARMGDDGAHIGVLVDPAMRRQGIGSHLLAAVEAAVRDAGWRSKLLSAAGPAAFYRARSRWSVADEVADAGYSKLTEE